MMPTPTPEGTNPPKGKNPLPTSAARFNHCVGGIVGVDPHIDHLTDRVRIHSILRPSRITRPKDRSPVWFSHQCHVESHIRVDKRSRLLSLSTRNPSSEDTTWAGT